MKREEVMGAIQRAAIGSTLSVISAPTDEQIRAIGERVAELVKESDDRVEVAEYDHATMSIRIRFTADASGFPLKVTIGGETSTP